MFGVKGNGLRVSNPTPGSNNNKKPKDVGKGKAGPEGLRGNLPMSSLLTSALLINATVCHLLWLALALNRKRRVHNKESMIISPRVAGYAIETPRSTISLMQEP